MIVIIKYHAALDSQGSSMCVVCLGKRKSYKEDLTFNRASIDGIFLFLLCSLLSEE